MWRAAWREPSSGMPNTVPLDASSLREVIERLPKALPARGTLVDVAAGPDAASVEFRVDYRTIGHALEWVYEGPVLLDAVDQTAGEDDLAERIRGRVGRR